MPTVHVFTSTGRFSSFEQMREFIDATFTEDGDLVPSRFMDEVQLNGYEPGCIEATHAPEPTSLRDLLYGVSYGEQWLHLVDPSVVASEAICVLEPNTLAGPRNRRCATAAPTTTVSPYPGAGRRRW